MCFSLGEGPRFLHPLHTIVGRAREARERVCVRERGGGGGERERARMTHHQNDSCIKTGSDERQTDRKRDGERVTCS